MILLLALLLAPDVTYSATADRKDVRLSDSVRVTLTVEGPAPLRVELPKELLDKDSLAKWRLRSSGPAKLDDRPGGRQRWSQEFRADPYDRGKLTLGFVAAKAFAGDAPNPVTVAWEPIADLDVASQLQESDTPRPITGIEELAAVAAPTDPWQIAGLVLAGCVLVALAGVIAAWLVRRRKPVTLTPTEWATRELDALDQDGDDFAERLSGVLRTYLERRSGLPATRRTTAELLAVAADGIPAEAVRPILERCDAAKFAGRPPTTDERRRLLAEARAIIATPERATENGPCLQPEGLGALSPGQEAQPRRPG